MVELPIALEASAGGILLTPHFLGPPPPGADHSDGHLLLVGVNNLGFCAVDRRSLPALDWWWSHLSTECLYDPLAGLFVDQKWMDIGSSHFQAASFRHPGYNVSVANLWERPLALDDDGYRIASTGDRLRLFHFHAFDSSAPEKLSVRARDSYAHLVQDDSVLLQLCKEYASVLSAFEASLPPAPAVPVRDRHAGPDDLAPAAAGLRPGAPARGAPRCRRRSSLPRPSPTSAGGAGPGARSPVGSCTKEPSASASCCPRSTTGSRSASPGSPAAAPTASPAAAAAGAESGAAGLPGHGDARHGDGRGDVVVVEHTDVGAVTGGTVTGGTVTGGTVTGGTVTGGIVTGGTVTGGRVEEGRVEVDDPCGASAACTTPVPGSVVADALPPAAPCASVAPDPVPPR